MDSAFAENGFEYDGASVLIDRGAQASGSLRGTNFTSSSSGSKPLRYLSCPVTDMDPKLRP